MINIKTLKIMVLVAISILTTGCAHRIEISPDVSIAARGGKNELIPAKVGYYFPSGSRGKEIVTPGGGGDRVVYKPYDEMDVPFSKILGSIFKNVYRLESISDSELQKNSIDYIFSVDLQTNSSSSSAFTWPPTWFSVAISSKINDRAGNIVDSISVTGEGQAEFPEFVGDRGLAGRRASLDALVKMQDAIIDSSKIKNSVNNRNNGTTEILSDVNSPLLHSSNNNISRQSNIDVAAKLKMLNNLYEQGLITKIELSAKRSKVLEGL